MLADSVGLALLVVLDTLTPAERLAFVLHDMFAMPFDRGGARCSAAPPTRRGSWPAGPGAGCAARRAPDHAVDLARQREVATAFLAASRGGDLSALVALLDSDVTLTGDAAAVPSGRPVTLHGVERSPRARSRPPPRRGVPAGPGGRGRGHRVRARRSPARRAGPDGQRGAPDHRDRRDRRPGPAATAEPFSAAGRPWPRGRMTGQPLPGWRGSRPPSLPGPGWSPGPGADVRRWRARGARRSPSGRGS